MNPDLSYWMSLDDQTLFEQVSSEENRSYVLDVMRRLTVDPVWTRTILEMVSKGEIETRCFVAWMARQVKPERYMEIGVRRGFSMAMVAAQSRQTTIWGFDLWVSDYAGAKNPGPSFIRSEIRRLGYNEKIHLISGDSQQTVPRLFSGETTGLAKLLGKRRHPVVDFQLILVDGNHSLIGAMQDLMNVMPHCSVGGAVIFDDICPDLSKIGIQQLEAELGPDPKGWKSLLGVWRAVQKEFSNFRYFEYLGNPPGVGVAVRLK